MTNDAEIKKSIQFNIYKKSVILYLRMLDILKMTCPAPIAHVLILITI